MFARLYKTGPAQPPHLGRRIIRHDPNANTSVAGIVSRKSSFPFISRGFHYAAEIVVERPFQTYRGFELDQFRLDSAEVLHP
jgi:hypothetical protein